MLLFPLAFSEKLGCIKSIEYKLEVDDQIKPTKQPLRPIAIHLREAVGEEIERQVDEGVLERVEPHHGSTPWVSNLVIVPKDKGVSKITSQTFNEAKEDGRKLAVRLTCDSRALNKAVKRTRYPSKTTLLQSVSQKIPLRLKVNKIEKKGTKSPTKVDTSSRLRRSRPERVEKRVKYERCKPKVTNDKRRRNRRVHALQGGTKIPNQSCRRHNCKKRACKSVDKRS